jgi:hypothetical protein
MGEMAEIPERVGILETKMDRVEEGVANFRDFQKDAREFFTDSRSRAIAEKEFHDRRDKENAERQDLRDKKMAIRLTILGLVLGALALWPIIKDVLGVKVSVNAPPSVSQQSAPQDTKLPPGYVK